MKEEVRTGAYINAIGKNGSRGMKTAYHIGLSGTKEFENMKNKIHDIEIPSELNSPGVCVLSVSKDRIVVSETTYILSTDVEPRPHTYQHGFVIDYKTFGDRFKNILDEQVVDQEFTHGPISALSDYNYHEKISLKEMKYDKDNSDMSFFWKSLEQKHRWNLFTRLYDVIKNKESILIDAEEWNPRNIQADFYRCLPMVLATKLSSLSCGISQQYTFNILFQTDKPYPNEMRYKKLRLKDLYQKDSLYDGNEYLYLCSLIVSDEYAVLRDFNQWLFDNKILVTDLRNLNTYAEEYIKQDGDILSKNMEKDDSCKKSIDLITEEEVYGSEADGDNLSNQGASYLEDESLYSNKKTVDIRFVFEYSDVKKFFMDQVKEYLQTASDDYTYIQLRQFLLSSNLPEECRQYMRSELRKYLSKIRVVKGKEELYVRLVFLAFSQTDEEFIQSRRNQFTACEMGPYCMQEIYTFLVESAENEGAWKKLVAAMTEFLVSPMPEVCSNVLKKYKRNIQKIN